MAKRLTTEDFINESKLIHGEFYDYSFVDYINKDIPVKIICPTHGEFFQCPGLHKNGSRCQKCSLSDKFLNREEFIKKSNDVHDLKYDYSKVDYINYVTKVDIICPLHGIFKQRPDNHINSKCGCKRCSFSCISKPEIKLFNELKIYFKDLLHNDKTFKTELDIVNHQTKRAIEFQGDFWHANPKIYNSSWINPISKKSAYDIWKRDSKKCLYMKNLGYDILQIWHSDFSKNGESVIEICKKFLNREVDNGNV